MYHKSSQGQPRPFLVPKSAQVCTRDVCAILRSLRKYARAGFDFFAVFSGAFTRIEQRYTCPLVPVNLQVGVAIVLANKIAKLIYFRQRFRFQSLCLRIAYHVERRGIYDARAIRVNRRFMGP